MNIIAIGEKPKYPKKTIEVEPTPCPMCGNYRLEFDRGVECPSNEWCKKQLGKKWHGKWQRITTHYEYFDKKPSKK